MPVQITLAFWGDVQLKRTLARYDAIDNATPLWNVLAGRFARLEALQFASEGAHTSGGWAPLSPRYAEWKAANYPGKTILRRTDALYESLTSRPLGIEILEPGFMVLGSDVDYGAYHQLGTDRMPRRRPVSLTESARRDWVKRIHAFLQTGQT